MTASTSSYSSASSQLIVRVKRLPHARGLGLPAYQSDAAAGMDLIAAVPADRPVLLGPGERALIPTGLSIALPPDTEGQVRPRSGLALRHGVTVLNSPGTIDADYRGEVMVLLINLGGEDYEIRRGERIAQLVFQRFVQADLKAVSSLDATPRGEDGFGSTGVKKNKKRALSNRTTKTTQRKADRS